MMVASVSHDRHLELVYSQDPLPASRFDAAGPLAATNARGPCRLSEDHGAGKLHVRKDGDSGTQYRLYEAEFVS